jgi:hypothetical protein
LALAFDSPSKAARRFEMVVAFSVGIVGNVFPPDTDFIVGSWAGIAM